MIKIDLKENLDPNLLSGRATKVETIMTSQILKDTARFVPASGAPAGLTNRAYTRGSFIVYPGPYARFLYYGMRMVNAATGRGPRWIPEVGWRWPKHAKLRPTSTPLHISTAVHADATSRWLEASKARNMKTWTEIAKRIYTDG